MSLPLIVRRQWAPLIVGCVFGSQQAAPFPPQALRGSAVPAILRPGDRLLRPIPTRSSGARWIYTQLNPGAGSIEHRIATEMDTEYVSADVARELKFVTRYSTPYEGADTLTVDPQTLAPIRERSAGSALDVSYWYTGPHVQGSVRRGTANPRTVSATFAGTPFAFSELPLIVRALRFRPSLDLVVPLFSEADGDLEHDTLRVVEDRVPPGGPEQWVVRFADPMIVQHYLVDARSRTIVSVSTWQRKTGNVLHQQRAPDRPIALAFVPGPQPPTRLRLVPENSTPPDTTSWTVERRAAESDTLTALQVMTASSHGRTTIDSVLFDRRTLLPLWERSHGGVTESVRFGGPWLVGSMVDSAGTAHPFTIASPGFAYSSVMDNVVVRSLPLAPGYTAVVPFFDGGQLELDTVRVASAEQTNPPAGGPTPWLVTLAEPYVVESLWIDPRSRRIVRHVYTSRADGHRLRVCAERPGPLTPARDSAATPSLPAC